MENVGGDTATAELPSYAKCLQRQSNFKTFFFSTFTCRLKVFQGSYKIPRRYKKKSPRDVISMGGGVKFMGGGKNPWLNL